MSTSKSQTISLKLTSDGRILRYTNLFTGKSRNSNRYNQLQSKINILEKKVDIFSTELEKYKANEWFDSLQDYGDIYPDLNQLEPDEVYF